MLAPEDQPTIIEIETFLPEGAFTIRNESPGMFTDGHTLSHMNFPFRNTKTTLQNKPTGYKLLNEEGQPIYPLLLVDWVEMDGSDPTGSRQEKTRRGDPGQGRRSCRSTRMPEAICRTGLETPADRCGDRPLRQAIVQTRTPGRPRTSAPPIKRAGRHPHLEELLLPRRRHCRAKAGQGQ